MCFNLKTGANLWSVFTSSLKGILLINDQLVELSDYHIRAFNAQTGAENWIQGSGFYKGVLGVSSVFDLDGHLYLVQSNNIAQLDLTTGCVLNYQPIELLGNGEYVVGFTKSASEKVLYISLLEQMLAVQL
jgi:outer membrane protein assembly factor BamB